MASHTTMIIDKIKDFLLLNFIEITVCLITESTIFFIYILAGLDCAIFFVCGILYLLILFYLYDYF